MGSWNLYKVLTKDGTSPFVCETYSWSLPTGDGAGGYIPGEWHEELNPLPGRGLWVTSCPSRHRGTPDSDITYLAEAEGLDNDPELEHSLQAKRVRLQRPLSEFLEVSEKWNKCFRDRQNT